MSSNKPTTSSNANVSNENNEIVSRADFYAELGKYYKCLSDNCTKQEWTTERVQQVIKILEDFKVAKSQGQKITPKQYHNVRKYEVLEVDNEKILIKKRQNESSTVVKIVPSEEYYDLLLKTHISTGHGGRDKIQYTIKENFIVPTCAVMIFVKLCKVCISKKTAKSGITVRPMNIKEFDKRGNLHIIDLKELPDNVFKFALMYQDHLTKFCFLRPLKTDLASEASLELLKIFLEIGCPNILQCENGREYTTAVIKEINKLWPSCRILNGKPKQESCSTGVENMLRTWMNETKSNYWPLGCYFVQFQLNSTYHRTLLKSPYKAMFGADPSTGLFSSKLPANVVMELENEEDLEKVLGCNMSNDTITDDHDMSSYDTDITYSNDHDMSNNENDTSNNDTLDNDNDPSNNDNDTLDNDNDTSNNDTSNNYMSGKEFLVEIKKENENDGAGSDEDAQTWNYFDEHGSRARCIICKEVVDKEKMNTHLQKNHSKLIGDEGSDDDDEDESKEDHFTEVVYLEEETPKTPKKVPKKETRKSTDELYRQPKRQKTIERRRKESTTSDDDEKEFEELNKFTKYINCLLKTVPKDVCTKLQMDIVNLIMTAKLKAQENQNTRYDITAPVIVTIPSQTQQLLQSHRANTVTATEASTSNSYVYTSDVNMKDAEGTQTTLSALD